MSDLNGLRQVGKKRGFRLVKTLNWITQVCIFRISSKRNAHPLCFCAFRLSETQKKLEPRLSTLWVFLSVAFRLSETHIRWPEKIGDAFVHAFFVRFALAKRQKSKCVFFFAFRLDETPKKLGTRLSTLFLRVFP